MSHKDIRLRILSCSCQPGWQIVCLTEYWRLEGAARSISWFVLQNLLRSAVVSHFSDIPRLCGKTYYAMGKPSSVEWIILKNNNNYRRSKSKESKKKLLSLKILSWGKTVTRVTVSGTVKRYWALWYFELLSQGNDLTMFISKGITIFFSSASSNYRTNPIQTSP